MLALLCVLLVAIALGRQPRPYLIAFVGLAAAYSLWDQARWIPPVYQYTLMLAALSFHSWRPDHRSRAESAINACRVVLAGTYLWAGLQKVNVTFLLVTFPWMLRPMVGVLPEAFRAWLVPLGLGAALMEAAIGVGLLLPPSRQMAVLAAVAMHALILLSIGPLGHWWDTNVWPWNIATAVLVVVAFWRTREVGAHAILAAPGFGFQWVVVALFVVMPAFGVVGLWDSYLSAEFYTGATRRGVIQLKGAVTAALPEDIRRHVRRTRSGDDVLDLVRWAFSDRNVEPYPEPRVFKATARALCRYAVDPSTMTLVVYEKPHWRTGRRESRRYTCADLA